MTATIKKGNVKKKLFKGAVLNVKRIEFKLPYKGRYEDFVIMEREGAEIDYPLMFVEISVGVEKK